MARRPLAVLLTLLVLCTGCSPAPLAHPAILGASASAGFGCEVTGSDGKPYLVDMEAVYQATVPGWHSDPVFLADAGFYSRPRKALAEQMDAALKQNPSVLVAIDALFWPVYAAREPSATPDAVRQDRAAALDEALAQLSRFNGPIIVGDIPDMRAATGRMLSERNIPPADQLADFNRRIHDWAAQRPEQGPAVIISAAALGRAIEAHEPLTTATGTIPTEQAAGLLQPDHLHPTPTGLALLLTEGLSGLASKGIISQGSFRSDLAEIAARLPAEARDADSRREPGLWTLLAIKGKLTDFGNALEGKDCAKADELFDQIMEKVTRLKKSPHEMADLYVSFTLWGYWSSCRQASAPVRRWRDRLAPAIERPLPDPWPLDLWSEFNGFLNDEPLTIERMLALKRSHPQLAQDYQNVLRRAARAARFINPDAYLELLPSWQAQLDRECKTAQEIADYWRGFAKTSAWPAQAEDSYKRMLQWAADDAKRKEIESRKQYYTSVEYTIATARSSTLEEIATLEHALRVTGRKAEAASVHERLAGIAGPDELNPIYTSVEQAAIKATSPAP